MLNSFCSFIIYFTDKHTLQVVVVVVGKQGCCAVVVRDMLLQGTFEAVCHSLVLGTTRQAGEAGVIVHTLLVPEQQRNMQVVQKQ